MSLTDPIADLITRIRNGQRVSKKTVVAPVSSFGIATLNVLVREGYIRQFSVVDQENGSKIATIELKYMEGRPVIRSISRVSTPGRRVYTAIKALSKVQNGLGVSILSTPKGVMSDHEARVANVGGEVLCKVF